MAQETKLSIIILNWNTRDLLEQCLESIYANEPECSFEVIVVDNNSTEDIGGLAEKFQEIRLIRNEYNHGFAVGNNIGYRQSTGNYVMTLNPDTLMFPGTIERLLEVLENDDSVGIAVPVSNGKKAHPRDHTFFKMYFVSMIFRKVRKLLERFRRGRTEPFDVAYIGGTGYICRRAILAEDKMFREDYFLFGEEYQLCRETAEKGFKIRVVPASTIEHFTSVTYKSDTERLAVATRLGIAITWRIHREWLGKIPGTITGLYLCIEHMPKLVFLRIADLFSDGSEKRRRATAQSRAVVASIIPFLKNETAYVKRVNAEAELFFNNGKKPQPAAGN